MSCHRFTVVALVFGALACTPAESPPASTSPPPYPGKPGTWGAPSSYDPPASTATVSPPLAAPGSPGCGKAPPPRAGAGQHVTAFGRDRAYTLVVPEGYAPATPYPLVFVLHGGGASGTAARAQTDLEKVAAGHAVFVYPEAIGGNWDLDAPASSNGDVALFDAILLVAHNSLCIDPHRVFVTGFSNGAYMANQLACRRGERIRAVVTHSGGGPYETHGTFDAQGHLVCPGKAVAALVVSGNNDGTVPPSEGQKSVEHWSFANRCGSATSSGAVAPCVALQGCFQPVGVCRIPGLGHGFWSQAGKVTWAFFDALR